jgi:MFS family permease
MSDDKPRYSAEKHDVESNPAASQSDKNEHEQQQQELHASDVPWTFTRVIAIISLCIVYVGAQAILYMTGGTLTYIGRDINSNFVNWLLTANTLAVTAVVPFVGYITDLLGRRYIACAGSIFLIIASVVQATSKSLGSSVVAQTIGGIGAGICELTALAG